MVLWLTNGCEIYCLYLPKDLIYYLIISFLCFCCKYSVREKSLFHKCSVIVAFYVKLSIIIKELIMVGNLRNNTSLCSLWKVIRR